MHLAGGINIDTSNTNYFNNFILHWCDLLNTSRPPIVCFVMKSKVVSLSCSTIMNVKKGRGQGVTSHFYFVVVEKDIVSNVP